MNTIQFRHKPNKRKTWLFPLLIIILLYLTIPVLLINKAKDSFDKASLTIESDVSKAANYFKSGRVFSELAENFPGFSAWAKKTSTNGLDEIIKIYAQKCNEIQNKSDEEQNKFCAEWNNFAKKTSVKIPECVNLCK